MEKEIERVYFTLAEVSRQVSAPTRRIRYWTSYFNISSKNTNRGANRKYTKGDIQKLIRIKSLTDIKCFTLLGIKRVLSGKITFKYHTQ